MYLVGLPCSDSFVDYSRNVTPNVDRKLVTCRQLNMAPGPPIDFGQERNRTGGCQKLLPSCIRNAPIWEEREEDGRTLPWIGRYSLGTNLRSSWVTLIRKMAH